MATWTSGWASTQATRKLADRGAAAGREGVRGRDDCRALPAPQATAPGVSLAHRLGVSHAWVSRRLSGEVPLTIADVTRIAAELGVEVSALTAKL